MIFFSLVLLTPLVTAQNIVIEQLLSSDKIEDAKIMSEKCYNALKFSYNRIHNKEFPINKNFEDIFKELKFKNFMDINFFQSHPHDRGAGEFVTFNMIYAERLNTSPKVVNYLLFAYAFDYGLDACSFAEIDQTNMTSTEYHQIYEDFSDEPDVRKLTKIEYELIKEDDSEFFYSNSEYYEGLEEPLFLHAVYKFKSIKMHPISIAEVKNNMNNFLEKIINIKNSGSQHVGYRMYAEELKDVDVLDLNNNVTYSVDMIGNYERELQKRNVMRNVIYGVIVVSFIVALLLLVKK